MVFVRSEILYMYIPLKGSSDRPLYTGGPYVEAHAILCRLYTMVMQSTVISIYAQTGGPYTEVKIVVPDQLLV